MVTAHYKKYKEQAQDLQTNLGVIRDRIFSKVIVLRRPRERFISFCWKLRTAQ